MTQPGRPQVQSGDRAPDFVLPAVHDDRTISLGDYLGRTPLLLGLFRGMYCPFCRRAMAQMAAISEHLKSLGVDSLAIVGTELENARLYFKFRPTRLALAADPHLTTHRWYGVPRPEPTPELLQMVAATYINPTGELPSPLPLPAASAALAALDGYQYTQADQRDAESTFTQMNGQFIIGRDGIVRWANIECGREGLPGMGKFPWRDELINAASTVIGDGTRIRS